ncbi:4-phosphoerythronate dehydrogenase [Aliikangiella sp. IMCC44359]|uniref:4-phosphoerythronate dehydrogenase n=1 Tax=Aliikangiella sp. IMCC44359 TaxID=3459125 RepID=UPI00403AD51A
MLTIVADESMPHVESLFASFGNIITKPGREISAEHVKLADALLCRSITPINEKLLAESNVQFVGTATIGVDHLDRRWLAKNNISWSNAAGCNASAVAQYVISALCYWTKKYRRVWQDLKVGIVGAGNVGTELARCLTILGIDYLLCDPLLQKQGDKRQFASMADMMNCDVITFHVPITYSGEHSTYHLVNEPFLSKLNTEQLVINAARGEVIDNSALCDYLNSSKHADFVLDTFEGEPSIDYSLLKKCLLATPHIAGHTLEGKSRGTVMIFEAFCKHFEIMHEVDNAMIQSIYPPKNLLVDKNKKQQLIDYLLSIYDIEKDHQKLLSAIKNTKVKSHIGDTFDRLRKNYIAGFGDQPRRDYSGWQLNSHIKESRIFNQLKALTSTL